MWAKVNARHRTLSSLDGKVQGEIMDRCNGLHESFLQPLNDRLHGPLEKSNTGGYHSTKMPFVFLLGNHSSGKSSFINYVLGRTIQKAGVAPTDDSFTIIAPGPSDIDQDGPALVGDPDMGFLGLRQFGPTLIHHTSLKIRSGISTNSFMMVDSPGMIDSPVSRQSNFDRPRTSLLEGQVRGASDSRGYDFQGVVRWFAERADVILLFFDPDKPGTTGETLSILTNSLPGMDHKLYIILNKCSFCAETINCQGVCTMHHTNSFVLLMLVVMDNGQADQFAKIHDFARAYGSLCWNLSKVIPRKDLPRIYTMCIPVQDKRLDGEERDNASLSSSGLQDLEATREDVKAEVMKAPKRRIDNIITRLTDSVHLLQVHTRILDDIQREYNRFKWMRHGTTISLLATGGCLTGGSIYLGGPVEVTGGLVAISLVGAAGLQYTNSKALVAKEDEMLSVEGLNHLFNKGYARELAEGDESISAVWKRIRDNLQVTLSAMGVDGVSRVKSGELRELQRILDKEVPDLRREAAPVRFSFFGAKSQKDDSK